jgi:hypothetical protein
MEFRKFIPIIKIDAAKREVYGIVTSEAVDKDGEICDYASTAPNYRAWSAEFEKATQGKSLGNVREMHANKAAGKVTSLDFDDAARRILIGAKIVDDEAWKKCEEGVYTGFSHGGAYVKVWQDGPHKRYTAKPSEVSLVDNPCNPEAHFEYVKTDGSVEVRKFASLVNAEDAEVRRGSIGEKTANPDLGFPLRDSAPSALINDIQKREVSDKERAHLADQGHAMPDGSYPIANESDLRNAIQAFGRAKDKGAVRTHIIRRAKQLGRTDLLPADWPGSTKKQSAVSDQRSAGKSAADGGSMEKAEFDAATKATLGEMQGHHEALHAIHKAMGVHHDALDDLHDQEKEHHKAINKCFGKLLGKAEDEGDAEEQDGDGEHDAGGDGKAAVARLSRAAGPADLATIADLEKANSDLTARGKELEAELQRMSDVLKQANEQLTKLLAEPRPAKAVAKSVAFTKDQDVQGIGAAKGARAEGLEMLKAIHRGEIG